MTVLLFKLCLFAIFLVLTAYFAGIETALTSLSTINLKKIRERYPKKIQSFLFWEKKPNELLTTALVGTNFSVIGAGVVSTSIAFDVSALLLLPSRLVFFGIPLLSVLLILGIGEIAPKIISRYKAETIAVRGITPLLFLNTVFTPFSFVLLRLSERVIGVFSKRPVCEIPFLRPEELRVLLLSEATSPLSTPARRMVNNILDFGKTRINSVMIHRQQIQAVNLDGDPAEIVNQIIDKGFSRVPVYRKDLDNIVGIVYSRDLNLSLSRESLFIIDDLIRPAYFVPETARIDKVLREFKTGHQHLAIVVDEFGMTAGLATIEDLVEEIVGEIWDEYDLQEKTILPLPDGFYLLKAGESLDKVNDELKFNLPANEFNTVSGWVLDLFGRIPKIGESVVWGNIKVEIVDASKRKISKVKMKRITETA